MSAEELCLSWDDHHKTLIGVFEKLLEKNTLVDCTIAAEGQYLKAHKVVLSACSPYFEMLFTQENEKNPIVVLKDIKFQDLKALIDFIYRGRVQIPGDRLGDFTSAAESLQIKGLGGGHKRNISERIGGESVSLYTKDGNNSPPSLKRPRHSLSDSHVKNVDVSVCKSVSSVSSVQITSRGCESVPDLPSCSTSASSSTFEKTYGAPSHSVRTHEELSERSTSFTEEQMNCASETKLEPISEVLLPESECLVEPKTEVCEEISILESDDEVDDALQSWNNEESNNSVYSSPHGSAREVSDNSFSGSLLAEQSNADILKEAEYPETKMLPEKSKYVYEREYGNFCKWRNDKEISGASEEVVLSYFNSKSKSHKSLWSYYSMLRATLRVKENVDISKYYKLLAFLKRQGEGHKPRKSKTFSKLEFYKFLKEACDEEFLLLKVVMIMGVAGGCRLDELYNMSVDDVQDRDTVFVVKVPDSRTQKDRLFTIVEKENGVEILQIVRKYMALRPHVTTHRHFFVSYRNQKCTVQPVGKNSFGKMPMMIAKFLNLPNENMYTGHCFRRSSASFQTDNGADFITLKSIWGI